MNQPEDRDQPPKALPAASRISELIGVLLAACAPLGLAALGTILGAAPEDLLAALGKLGGIVARDEQGRVYLDRQQLKEDPDLAPGDSAAGHRRLAAWCAGAEDIWHDSADAAEQQRRIYARHFNVAHLAAGQDWAELWRVMDSESYGRNKMAFDPSTRLYALDLDRAGQAAVAAGATLGQQIALLPRLWRYSLLRGGLSRQIDGYPMRTFVLMARCGRLQEAAASIELLSSAYRAFHQWCALAVWAIQSRQAEAAPFLERARLVGESMEDPYRASYLVDIAGGYRAAGQPGLADRLLDEALALARANQEESLKSAQLSMIALQLAQSGRVDEALDTAGASADPEVRARLCCEVAAGLHKRGEQHAGATVMELALAAAASIAGARSRDLAWGEIAVQFAAAGETRRALAAAVNIQDRRSQAEGLLAVARHMARSSPDQEKLTILDGAIGLARNVYPARAGISLCLEGAAQLKDCGALEAAAAVVEDALAFVSSLGPGEAAAVAGTIAPALARHGRVGEALALAESQPEVEDWEEEDRSDTLKSIALIVAETGATGAALAIARRIEDAELRGTALLDIAALARARGDQHLTADLIEQAFAAFQTIDDRERRAERLAELVDSALRSGDEDRAGDVLEELIDVARTINIHFSMHTAYALWEIGSAPGRAELQKAALAQGRLISEGTRHASNQPQDGALPLVEDAPARVRVMALTAVRRARNGDRDQARALAEEVVAAARMIADPIDRVNALVDAGRLLCMIGRPGEAAGLLNEIPYPHFFHSLAQAVLAAGADDESLAIIVRFIQNRLLRRETDEFQSDLRLLSLFLPDYPALAGEFAASLDWANSMIDPPAAG